MSNEGKIGLNGGLDTSRSHRSAAANGRNVLARSIRIRPASPARGHAKMIGLLLVVGVAIVVVAALSLAPLKKATQPNSAEMNKAPPGTPYLIAGYCYDADGVTKLPGCSVVVTDVTKSVSSPVLTSNANGFYSTDLGSWAAWELGDQITVHAELGTQYGDNSAVVSGTALALSVTLNLVIPEFPAVVLPIVGMVGLVIAISVISRRD